MTEPKPCPFCGHVGLNFAEGSTFRWVNYYCGGCGIGSETRVQTMGSGSPQEWRAQAERDAIAEWNRRAEPPNREAFERELSHLIECTINGAATYYKPGQSTHDANFASSSRKALWEFVMRAAGYETKGEQR